MKKKVNNKVKSRLRLEEKLAEERTLWSNEQTTLAYIRTGFSALLLGIGLVGLIKIFGSSTLLIYGSFVSLLIGIFFIILGLVDYSIRAKKIKAIAE